MTAPTAPGRLRLLSMRPRDPAQPHRVASALELFFDLVFVVAVSVASLELHHALAADHVVDGLISYALVFFAIWWAWMNFTWFATSFDTDDWLYRVLTLLQMAGVLVLAAGIPAVFQHDFLVVILGYVVMRVAMIAQWLRASRAGGAGGRAARWYAAGIGVVQVLWLVLLVLPSAMQLYVVPVLVLAEIAVPVVAELRGATPTHPHHITERYGLFTLILLGEGLLGSANAMIEAIHAGDAVGRLLVVAALSFLVTAAMWWIYFWPPHHRAITSLARSLRYGYVHYVVFAAAGALAVGIELQIDAVVGHVALPEVGVALALTIPVALFVGGIWWIALRAVADALVNVVVPVAAVLVLLSAFLPWAALPVSAGVLVVVVVVLAWRRPRAA